MHIEYIIFSIYNIYFVRHTALGLLEENPENIHQQLIENKVVNQEIKEAL